VTKTQIDRLGDRLRKGIVTDPDLRLLDLYRRSFREAYEAVVGSIQQQLGLEPTGRPAKSTTSISEKLRRESIRLTQMQDIAGCRLIVLDVANQEHVVEALGRLFDEVTLVDRRDRPSYGYRAVHLIVTSHGKVIEIQVRTALQHLWAEVSEKFSDVVDPAIKYGGGAEQFRDLLVRTSNLVAAVELQERRLADLRAMRPQDQLLEDFRQEIEAISEDTSFLKQELSDLLADMIVTAGILERSGRLKR
jgi:putative GTP pyrophosphokinase